ncbi:DUF6876 family protein [Sphingobacterium lactis]|uniref:DUF6876 family protein n=1 Tax=Sphingobacterium TaxID=28453 RepID=UPI0021A7894F|nr:DUF6876 family protein [Sphingobacterium hotanense]MCT1525311.1 hypothetical protein [Sphingobacterium hotanense]
MEMTNLNKTAEFAAFYGTTAYYQFFLGTNLTDGVKHLADQYQCFWFLSEIAIRSKNHPKEPFQVWKLKRVSNDSNAFVITGTNGNRKILETVDIPFSDFKAGEVEVWITEGVMLLPSEY